MILDASALAEDELPEVPASPPTSTEFDVEEVVDVLAFLTLISAFATLKFPALSIAIYLNS